ncbi:MAG TPA: hypothetical protein VKA26_11335 [Ignavibacteriaceae bacterium]|nr:hypothetical protein [Ignavibacteriaceae bacterium]
MFSTNEIRGYGFWSPTAISGSTEVQLYYLASGNDLLDKINSDSTIGKNIREQFLKDEKIGNPGHKTNLKINKFIERKGIHF